MPIRRPATRRNTTLHKVDVTQTAQNLDGALKAFVAKLGTELPGVPCRGWDGSVQLDSEAIRKLAEP